MFHIMARNLYLTFINSANLSSAWYAYYYYYHHQTDIQKVKVFVLSGKWIGQKAKKDDLSKDEDDESRKN